MGVQAVGSRKKSIEDVLVKRRDRETDWYRKWSSVDVTMVVLCTCAHLVALSAPFLFNWSAFWVFVALQFIFSLFGISLSYHRNLTHNSFKLPKILEYFFAYLGVLSGQVRYHHQYCDLERDPHSPNEGFWFSRITWSFDREYIREKAVRFVWQIHAILLVNSVCHSWGSQPWNAGNLSKNNWLVGLISYGEGWHNNHHAFESSAMHGFEWWQIDMTWYVIKLLEALGLATQVKLVTHSQKLSKKAF